MPDPGATPAAETIAAALAEAAPRHVARVTCANTPTSLANHFRQNGIEVYESRETAAFHRAELIICDSRLIRDGDLGNILRQSLEAAGPNGMVCLVCHRGAHIGELGEAFNQVYAFAGAHNAVLYRVHTIGVAEDVPPEEVVAQAPVIALWFVHAGYNPILHANALIDAHRENHAIALLTGIPPEFVTDDNIRRVIAETRHRAYTSLIDTAEPSRIGYFFSLAQKSFFYSIRDTPDAAYLYRHYAEMWQRVGNPDMARRVLRSVQHALPTPEAEALLNAVGEGSAPYYPAPAYGEWSGAYKPRILIISHDSNDYGLDTLFDGICRLIGPENVVVFPYKPMLHGGMAAEEFAYPCLFDYPAEPQSVEQLADALLGGQFDLVVYSDVLGRTHPIAVRALLKAATGLPLVIYDDWDDWQDAFDPMMEQLGIENCLVRFKREMVTFIDYGPDTWPLPFGYADGYVPDNIDGERTEELFWAGTPLFGLRPLYISHLESATGRTMNRQYTQPEYKRALLRSRVGLSLFGYGFDTVRYWEVPAHGTMLLAEHIPIHLPNDYTDGESAVFFDDLADLETKIDYYTSHPEEAAAIAAKGREHLIKHHLCTHRARQFLGTIEQRLCERGKP